MYNILIIGGGVTGLLALAIAQKHLIKNIGIIDPNFHGGDLMKNYGHIQSNTPLLKTINGLKLIDESFISSTNYPLDKTAPLYIHTQCVQELTDPYLSNADCIQDTVESIHFSENRWVVKTEDNTYISKVVFLCQGSNAKKLDCGIPIIPLEEALYKDSLKKYLKPNDKVLVFGTSHSGVLVLHNCEELRISTTAIYKKEKPFYFANEGDYDGIKEDAEIIAKRILNNEYKHINLISTNSIDKLLKVVKYATKVIYAIGFETRKIKIEKDGEIIDSKIYNKKTGVLTSGLWGFGIAYPSSAPDDIHVDVGIISFVEHILNQINDVKNYLSQN